ncbi:MAG: hypothetical protein WEE89_14550 [Gemmatimonadota bacterium]
MSRKIKWKVDVTVESGPTLTAGDSIDVEAYDFVRAEVPGGDATTAGTATVDVQPSGAGKVLFIGIKSDVYDEKLTYKVDGAGLDVKLDSAQVFVGGGALGLLGTTTKQFVFTNKAGLSKKAAVEILVGRKAT